MAQELRLAPDRPLTFVDADGRTVRSTDFAGKWLLVYFGYTHCTDLCPTGLSVLANALDQIGPAAEHVQPLFITVDPERDKGPLLRTFTQSFDKRLIGLGGTRRADQGGGNGARRLVREGGAGRIRLRRRPQLDLRADRSRAHPRPVRCASPSRTCWPPS